MLPSSLLKDVIHFLLHSTDKYRSSLTLSGTFPLSVVVFEPHCFGEAVSRTALQRNESNARVSYAIPFKVKKLIYLFN